MDFDGPIIRWFTSINALVLRKRLDEDTAYADRQREEARKLQKRFGSVLKTVAMTDTREARSILEDVRPKIDRSLSRLDDDELAQRGRELLVFAEAWTHVRDGGSSDFEQRVGLERQIEKFIDKLGAYWR